VCTRASPANATVATIDAAVPIRKTRRAPIRSASSDDAMSDRAYANWKAEAMLPAAVPDKSHSRCNTGSVAAYAM
jgi:hypothetical protein